MRTTVTLDPDIEAMLKRVMRERGVSFKEALNSAVRDSLAPSKRSPFARLRWTFVSTLMSGLTSRSNWLASWRTRRS